MLALITSMPLARRALITVARWRQAVTTLGNPYRPELHYMRGPGPRWHAKQRLARAVALRRPDQ